MTTTEKCGNRAIPAEKPAYGASRPSLIRGDEILTNYSGPYIVVNIDGPCTCPKYLTSSPSREHWHIVCTKDDPADRKHYYLGGYVEDPDPESLAGETWIHSIWLDDWLWRTGRVLTPEHERLQLELFA